MSLRLQYSPGRGTPMDVADAELQTDVMRFIAILSLCLVAISALVQSIPAAPRPQEPPRESAAPQAAQETAVQETIVPVTTAAQRAEVPPEPMREMKVPVTNAAPRVEAPAEPERETRVPVTVPVREDRPAEPKPMDTAPAEPQTRARAAPQQQGFTLQFEDDAALTRLISRDEVGFFAISADKSLRLKIAGNRMDFWPSSTPAQYHEMDASTVPAEVRMALLRSGAEFAGEQLWGVTLPPGTAAQLKQYLAGADGGRLVIGRSGDLRLEQ